MKPFLNVACLVFASLAALPFLGDPRADAPAPASAASSAAPATGAPIPAVPPQSACLQTANALKQASRKEALADYWEAVARCRNGAGVNACIDDAEDELDEAWDLIDEQHEARLALCPLLGSGPYNPTINPANFSANITNPYFPIIPGRTLIYQKMTDEGLEQVEITHLPGVVMVNGVPCRAVRDLVTLDGVVIEDTEDWYSQKNDGTVWYMGEIAKNYEDGLLDNLDGSWRFGKNGAKPGIIMLAMPFPNAAYRQEFDVNNAEDVAKVLSLVNTVSVPAGTFMNCLKTLDWTPLSPDSLEHKFYAIGVGLVKEADPNGGGDPLKLIQIIN